MALKIISQKDNMLLKRVELDIEVDFQGATPSKSDIRKMIASKQGSSENLVVVKIIDTLYGEQKAKAVAHVYKSIEDLKKLEKVAEKDEKPKEGEEEKPAEKEKAPEEKVEAKPEEQPKEEKKEAA